MSAAINFSKFETKMNFTPLKFAVLKYLWCQFVHLNNNNNTKDNVNATDCDVMAQLLWEIRSSFDKCKQRQVALNCQTKPTDYRLLSSAATVSLIQT